MDEIVPVILGAVLGAVIWRTTKGRTRFVLSVLAVIFAAFAATLSSGEYLESWIYLLLDLGEAAFGLVLGYLVAARLFPVRTARDATEAPR